MQNPKDFLDTYRAAVEALDADALLALYADDVRVFDVMEPSEYTDKEGFAIQIRGWLASLKPGGAECEIEDVSFIESDSLAVITGYVEYEGNLLETDEEVEMESRITWVLQKLGEEWLVVHEHGSIPVSEEDAWEDDDDDGADQVLVGEDEEDDMSEDTVNDQGESDAETVDGQDVGGTRAAQGEETAPSEGEQIGDKTP